MTELVERVKIQACESSIPGVRIDTLETEGGSVNGVIFRAESDAIINGITELVKSTFQENLGFYQELLSNCHDSKSAVEDIFKGAVREAKNRCGMTCKNVHMEIIKYAVAYTDIGIIEVSSRNIQTIINFIESIKKMDWNHFPTEFYGDIVIGKEFTTLAPNIYFKVFTKWYGIEAIHYVQFTLAGDQAFDIAFDNLF